MRFGDARGAECNAGHVFGRAAAYLVIDQRGKPLVVRVRTGSYGVARLREGFRKIARGGAVADFVLVISGSRRRPRRSQVRGQLRHDPIATAG